MVMMMMMMLVMGRQGRASSRTGRRNRLRETDDRLRRWRRNRRVVVGNALEGAIVLLALVLALLVARESSGLRIVAHFRSDLSFGGGGRVFNQQQIVGQWFQFRGLASSAAGFSSLAVLVIFHFAGLWISVFHFWAHQFWAIQPTI